LIRYRPFLNSDPPAITEIWRSQPQQRGLMQPMTPQVFERLVLSKQYFDRHGFVVAVDGERPVGFSHAGFGASDDGSAISTESGVTCMLMVAPHADQFAIAAELLARSEAYLCGRGARTLYGGGMHPLNPFYLGLYGGSELPGVLLSDTRLLQLFQSAGYAEINRCLVLQRNLSDFRPVVDRGQMQVRRQYQIDATLDLPTANWWQACTIGQIDGTLFKLRPRAGGPICGQVSYWDMQPLAGSWGVQAMGMFQVEIPEPQRRQRLATFLIGETLRQMQLQGVTLVEAQVKQSNTAALALYKKLGFQQVDQGLVLRKMTGPTILPKIENPPG
jgi:RimJ/RimL family protein N-acetyltransferase